MLSYLLFFNITVWVGCFVCFFLSDFIYCTEDIFHYLECFIFFLLSLLAQFFYSVNTLLFLNHSFSLPTRGTFFITFPHKDHVVVALKTPNRFYVTVESSISKGTPDPQGLSCLLEMMKERVQDNQIPILHQHEIVFHSFSGSFVLLLPQEGRQNTLPSLFSFFLPSFRESRRGERGKASSFFSKRLFSKLLDGVIYNITLSLPKMMCD